MAHILTIDLKNLLANQQNYKIVSFPKRIKITEMSFSVNGAALGDSALERVWKLYAWGGHPTPTEQAPWANWSMPVFNFNEKPVIENATGIYGSTRIAPMTQLVSTPNGGGVLKLELNNGVFAPGDFMTVWVQSDGGDISELDWETTEATVNIVYEETALKSAYELVQENPWLD